MILFLLFKMLGFAGVVKIAQVGGDLGQESHYF
jgi:hypothetical protein